MQMSPFVISGFRVRELRELRSRPGMTVGYFVHTAIRPEPFITDHLLSPEETSV